MKYGNFHITAPLMLGGEINEAEVLGASVWLWMHSPQHNTASLNTLPTLLLPIIKNQQFVLVSEGNKPVFFLSWAWMNEQAECRYFTEDALMFREEDWTSGERLWIHDWIAPFGHSIAMKRIVTDIIFPEHFGRMIYHKTKNYQTKTWYGKNTRRQEREQWYREHPVIKDEMALALLAQTLNQ
ncbi:toxin-activating lysine-acyltransferase [Limnobaculum zhutongyuii]|uniref:RTX toxin-activating lysine-acyltransferase n=1 Tax=Limnobaculum zhutongyuii TaxID=2498113 RepID=A0A411WGV9_9GAMM|nr:toxin-activating lysine-acyltransferase [Limnobaculum zhutongyuii]QBH95453.1 toxin-activating lysine-acyltransferase [Limnobaculum zhutongyuii]TQS88858.1 toxin-activating lysine-acyltransferase [Limnobaculum zhutongyuii]